MWVILTADSVLLTFWPPAPWDLYLSTFKSAGLIFTSLVSTCGMTTTVAVDVWILPFASVFGTLWTLWTPLSNFNLE